MGKEAAEKITAEYLASFPYLSLPNPDGYIAALDTLFAKYPAWAAMFVIQRENPDNPNIPVSSIQFRKWLEETVAPHRIGANWQRQSEKQIEDRKLITGAAQAALNKQSYEDFKMEMAERGLPIDGRKYVRLEDDVAAIKGRFSLSDAQWDALPDAAKSDTWEQLVERHRTGR